MNNNQSILITGGAGFIGSNFIAFFLEKYQNISIVNLDKLTYAGELSNLKEHEDNQNYTFVKGDICDVALVNELFNFLSSLITRSIVNIYYMIILIILLEDTFDIEFVSMKVDISVTWNTNAERQLVRILTDIIFFLIVIFFKFD